MNVSRIEAVQPQRSRDGCWTHPHYFIPDGDAEGPGEFNAWLAAQQLECSIRWMREEVPPELMRTYQLSDGDISRWQPAIPQGSGWFIGSLHDTQQGAVCIWLRRRAALEKKRTATGAAL
ncbi:hypothetical protein [Erwinia sp. MYb416]|uniref:hypothetical protein n=1 Tax=Erwinia sp. MYb416 TaxID=3108532 RepID=UPI0030949C2A